jgi:hypothetical protein
MKVDASPPDAGPGWVYRGGGMWDWLGKDIAEKE